MDRAINIILLGATLAAGFYQWRLFLRLRTREAFMNRILGGSK